tara:strand:+ start:176 stop:742 length:567 start_codon:yes stop_codon:yes gene_type:complete
MARTPFKMKSTPMKGRLADFFKGIGAKKTDMGELRAKQARSSKGVSEFQHKTTKAKATSKAKKASDKAREADVASDAEFFGKHREAGTTPGTPIKPKKEVVVDEPKTKVTGALGSKTRKEQYDAKGWRYDETIKGYNRDGTKIKTKVKTKVKKTKLGQVDPKTGSVNVDYVGEKKAPIKNYKKGYYKK